MDLSIIIVSWNVKNLLKKCLESIYRETKNIKYEVFVVDNASKDETVEMVQNEFPQVHLIANQNNLGFAKANNQAIQQAKGDFILLLNPDTEIIENALDKMVSFMKSHPEAGVAGCQILNPDRTIQPSVRRFPTLASHIIILLKLHNFFSRAKSIRNYYIMDFSYQAMKEVDQVMGACLMTKREVIDKVGLLDDKFFIWYEEVDFCQRVKKAGWKVLFSPEAKIIHEKGKSFDQYLPVEKQAMLNKSILYYFHKHRPFGEYFILILFYPVSLFLAFLVQLFKVKKTKKYL